MRGLSAMISMMELSAMMISKRECLNIICYIMEHSLITMKVRS